MRNVDRRCQGYDRRVRFDKDKNDRVFEVFTESEFQIGLEIHRFKVFVPDDLKGIQQLGAAALQIRMDFILLLGSPVRECLHEIKGLGF